MPSGALGAPWRLLGDPLETLGLTLGHSSCPLGAWGHLSSTLEAIFLPLWAHFGASWPHLGALGASVGFLCFIYSVLIFFVYYYHHRYYLVSFYGELFLVFVI